MSDDVPEGDYALLKLVDDEWILFAKGLKASEAIATMTHNEGEFEMYEKTEGEK